MTIAITLIRMLLQDSDGVAATNRTKPLWTALQTQFVVQTNAQIIYSKSNNFVQPLMSGKSNDQIGVMLGQKTNTVAKHLHEVYDKMGVDNRSGAIAFGRQLAAEGLI